MLESGLSGSVRGVPSNGHPYRDPGPEAAIRLEAAVIRQHSQLALSAFGTETFSSLNDLLAGLRKMRGIHEPSLGERCVPYGHDHVHHLPGRGRLFHLDWNVLKGTHVLGSVQMQGSSSLGT
jgi:hypothetical protein